VFEHSDFEEKVKKGNGKGTSKRSSAEKRVLFFPLSFPFFWGGWARQQENLLWEREFHRFIAEFLVYCRKRFSLLVANASFLGIQIYFHDPSSVYADLGTLSNDLCGVSDIVEDGLVDGG
jgi:hypothetical protein